PASVQNVALRAVKRRRCSPDSRPMTPSQCALPGGSAQFAPPLDPFHLRHGDVHEHDVGMSPVVFRDGGQAIACLAGHLSTKGLDHASQVLARKDGIVDDQVAHWLPIFAAFDWRKLLHNILPITGYHTASPPTR